MTNSEANNLEMEKKNLEMEKKSANFSIDLSPVENKEDKFSWITNLSLIHGIDRSISLKLGFSGDSSDVRLQNTPKKFFYEKAKENGLPISTGFERWLKWNIFFNCGILLFKTKSFEIKGKYIIIETSDNESYIGIFEDYLKSGLKALECKQNNQIQSFLTEDKRKEIRYTEGTLLKIKSKQLLNIVADDYCIIDEDQKQFCVLKDNKIATYTYTDDAINRLSDYYDLRSYGKIKNIKTDINNNFYFIIAEQEGKSQLKVLNRKTLEDVLSFSDITEIVYLSNEQGKLFCMDKEGYLRVVTINTKQLPKGYVDTNEISAESTKRAVIRIEDKGRKKLDDALKGGIQLDGTETSITEAYHEDQKLIDGIRNTKIIISEDEEKTLKELYIEAKNLNEINRLLSLAKQLKQNPKIMAVKNIMDPIMHDIAQKKEILRIKSTTNSLKEISSNLLELTDFSDMVSVKKKLEQIKRERSQILVNNKDLDLLIRKNLQFVDQKILEYQKEHTEEIITLLEQNKKRIKEYLDNIDYIVQITSIYNTDIWKNTKNMIKYLTEKDQKTWNKNLDEIVRNRQKELQANIHQEKKNEQQKQELIIEQIKIQINEIKKIILNVNEEETLEQIEKSDPLVLQIREKILGLPSQKAQELEARLDQIFKERNLSIKFSKEEHKGGLGTLDQYGIPKSLYFVPDIEKKVKWDIVGKELKDGKIKLQFISSAGNTIEPNINKKIIGNFNLNYTQEERLDLRKKLNERNKTKKHFNKLLTKKNKTQEENEEINKLQKEFYIPRMLDVMNKITGEHKIREIGTRNNLPSLSKRTAITPSVADRLAEWGQKLNLQLLYKQGYLIVESEAGTGKNFKCDILGHLTNREVFDVSCNEHMEKEDLLFSPEIDNEGTYRKPSELVRGLQTPGAIIVLDEVNTLRPGVSKLLNPLLDGRRYINDAQLGKIHVHPSVVIIGLMNPRYYRGTREIPQEQISRAIFTTDSYQPKDEEAFSINGYGEGNLSELSFEEFNQYWQEYIVQGQKPTNTIIYNHFINLDKIVRVAQKIRENYSKTMKGDAEIGEEMDFIFTMREGIQVIQDLIITKDVEQSLKNIIIPKIADFEQKEYAEKIIEEICS